MCLWVKEGNLGGIWEGGLRLQPGHVWESSLDLLGGGGWQWRGVWPWVTRFSGLKAFGDSALPVTVPGMGTGSLRTRWEPGAEPALSLEILQD